MVAPVNAMWDEDLVFKSKPLYSSVYKVCSPLQVGPPEQSKKGMFLVC